MKREKLKQEIAFLQGQTNESIGQIGVLTYNWFNSVAQLRDKTLSKIIRANQLKAKLDAKVGKEKSKPLEKVPDKPKK